MSAYEQDWPADPDPYWEADWPADRDEYDQYLASLRDKGQTGDIDDAYDRLQNLPGTGTTTKTEEEGG